MQMMSSSRVHNFEATASRRHLARGGSGRTAPLPQLSSSSDDSKQSVAAALRKTEAAPHKRMLANPSTDGDEEGEEAPIAAPRRSLKRKELPSWPSVTAEAPVHHRAVRSLRLHGACVWNARISASARAELVAAAESAVNSRGLDCITRRTSHVLDVCALPPGTRRELFTERLEKILRANLGVGVDAEVLLLGAQVVHVHARAPQQYTHRDHGSGARRVVCLAIALESGGSVGTLFAPGSHLREDIKDEINAPVEPIETGDNKGGILFDTYVLHAGASNVRASAAPLRAFFTFVASATVEHPALLADLKESVAGLHPRLPAPLSDLLK